MQGFQQSFFPDYNLTGDNVVLFKLRKIVFVN